jgi:hypothetical protein
MTNAVANAMANVGCTAIKRHECTAMGPAGSVNKEVRPRATRMVPLMDEVTTPLAEGLNPAGADAEGGRIPAPVVFLFKRMLFTYPGTKKLLPLRRKCPLSVAMRC